MYFVVGLDLPTLTHLPFTSPTSPAPTNEYNMQNRNTIQPLLQSQLVRYT